MHLTLLMAMPASCMEAAVPPSMEALVPFSPRMHMHASPYVEALTVVSSFGVGELSAINGLAGGMHYLRTIQSLSILDSS
jgi:hypothetical protein